MRAFDWIQIVINAAIIFWLFCLNNIIDKLIERSK